MNHKIENINLDEKSFRKIILNEETIGISDINEVNDLIKTEINSGNKNIAVDLANVKTINSSGLGVLINCLKITKEAEGEFKLMNPGEKLIHIFKITKLDTVFEISS